MRSAPLALRGHLAAWQGLPSLRSSNPAQELRWMECRQGPLRSSLDLAESSGEPVELADIGQLSTDHRLHSMDPRCNTLRFQYLPLW